MLHLGRIFADTLIEHSKKELPYEACGILAGKAHTVEKVFEMVNSDQSEKTYCMDPREQFKVMKEIRSLGLELLGIYHSHPHTDAYPSNRDIELAYFPQVSYVIVSLQEKGRPYIRSFKIADGSVEEEEIRVEGGTE